MLLNEVHNFFYLTFAALEFFIKLFMNGVVYRQQSCIAYRFIVGIKRFFYILNAEIFNFLKYFGIGVV